ncbi:phage portal protein [Azospirillum sp.]|uniref:phage portal protein n=1 Tax=Azospirillum sp. TaxID=34012 RepID=UPI003D7201F6
MKIGPFEFRLSRRSSEAPYDQWQNIPFFGYGATAAGVAVTSENPISHHTVFSCINVIAEGVAMLPLYPYRGRKPNQQLATDHDLFELLTVAPNPFMTAFAYFKLVIFEKLHYGKHYSLKDIDPATGRLRGLYPIERGRVLPFWYNDPETGLQRRAYRVTAPSGRNAVFLEDEIFHVQNLPILRGAYYCLDGLSVWQHYQAETIGGALSVEQSANSALANGAVLSGLISVKAPLSDPVAKEIREQVQDRYAGPGNAGKIGVFGHDATFVRMNQTAEEAQQLETRKFNRSVIAGILRVSAHLINDLEKATFSNIEHLDLAHYKHCLTPHLIDLCQTMRKDLLTPAERETIYVEHDPTILLLGDQKTLGEVLEKGIQSARYTPNEARAISNKPPLPGGDELYINSASVPLRQAAQGIGAKPAAEQQKRDAVDAA